MLWTCLHLRTLAVMEDGKPRGCRFTAAFVKHLQVGEVFFCHLVHYIDSTENVDILIE
ncbi:hypothetical protein MPTK1_2g06750 [Marchantia polymorpha subsp. ruderalis]|nr:hypothetical protein Mp_2g06750 [Marchantia polymorpha subsp. ruderalis]